jgi:hypothetical protein
MFRSQASSSSCISSSQCSTNLGVYGASTSSVIGVTKFCVHMVPAGSQ